MNLDARIHIITEADGGGIVGGGPPTANILVGALFLQDGLESCIAEDDASGKERIDDSGENLYYRRCKMIGWFLARGWSWGLDLRILLHLGTSKAPTESMCPGLP